MVQEVVDDINPLAGTSSSGMLSGSWHLGVVHANISGALLHHAASLQALQVLAWRRRSCRRQTSLVRPSFQCCNVLVAHDIQLHVMDMWPSLGACTEGVKRKRSLSLSYKEKYYPITNAWKEAKKSKTLASLMGQLVHGSFQEIFSTPPCFQVLVKERATAYLENFFLQEAISKGTGSPPSDHQAEYQQRVRVAFSNEVAVKREAFRILDYRMAFLLNGEKKESGKAQAPSWAPGRTKELLMAMAPKLRTEPAAISACCVIWRLGSASAWIDILLDLDILQGLQRS